VPIPSYNATPVKADHFDEVRLHTRIKPIIAVLAPLNN
jgi:hypothetical protein